MCKNFQIKNHSLSKSYKPCYLPPPSFYLYATLFFVSGYCTCLTYNDTTHFGSNYIINYKINNRAILHTYLLLTRFSFQVIWHKPPNCLRQNKILSAIVNRIPQCNLEIVFLFLKVYEKSNAYSYRSVLNIFNEVYLFCC